MSRKRVIDTAIYFDSEICELLGPIGLHVYICLWGIAEDSGVYIPNYSDISLKTGALRIPTSEVQKYIEALVNAKKVIPFTVQDQNFHWCKNLLKHQPLNNPTVPKLPLPEWIFSEVFIYQQSNRKYAKFKIIIDRLPVGYMSLTSSLPKELMIYTSSLPPDYVYGTSSLTVTKETKRNETETKRNETETKDNVPGPAENSSGQVLSIDPGTGKVTVPPKEPSEPEKLSHLLASLILINNPNFRELKPERSEGTKKRWAADIDRMIRLDGKDRTPENIAAVIVFCQSDDFWWHNILSGSKFREQYDKLTNAMKSSRRKFNEKLEFINSWLKENGYAGYVKQEIGLQNAGGRRVESKREQQIRQSKEDEKRILRERFRHNS